MRKMPSAGILFLAALLLFPAVAFASGEDPSVPLRQGDKHLAVPVRGRLDDRVGVIDGPEEEGPDDRGEDLREGGVRAEVAERFVRREGKKGDLLLEVRIEAAQGGAE